MAAMGAIAGPLPGGFVALPPVRNIGPVVARAKMPVGAIEQIVELADGRVVINDSRKANLAILSSSLDKTNVILGRGLRMNDGESRRYPVGGGTAVHYRGDTIVFAEPRARNFLVIDAAGKIVRQLPFPAGPSPMVGTKTPAGMHSDRDGRIVYWASGSQRCGDDPAGIDSTPLLRTDLKTLKVDTVSFARRNVHECQRRTGPAEEHSPATRVLNRLKAMVPVVPPTSQRDEWTVLSDGTVAIVRADYTIDWVPVGGKARSTSSVAAAPHRLSPSAKAAITDSLKTYYKRVTDSIYTNVALNDNQYKRLTDGERSKVTADKLAPRLPQPRDIPDELRAFQGPIRVDASDNLWVPEAVNAFVPEKRRTRVHPTVYDVIDRQGVLIDRVRLPDGATLLGFGRGVAYVVAREGKGRTLMRMKVH
jgi:hypothetical protein